MLPALLPVGCCLRCLLVCVAAAYFLAALALVHIAAELSAEIEEIPEEMNQSIHLRCRIQMILVPVFDWIRIRKGVPPTRSKTSIVPS